MVDKAKTRISDLIKDGRKRVMEPLSKAEEALEKATDRLTKNVEKLDATEVKKVYEELLGRVRSARGEMEKLLSSGLDKTLDALNLPTKDEVNAIKKDLAKLTKAVGELNKKAPAKPAKKAAAKAPAKAPKMAPKKAPKKAAKK